MRESPITQSHLFTVRLWREQDSSGEIEYRGQVQHVLTGQLRHFRDWETLIDFCRAPFDKGPPQLRTAEGETAERENVDREDNDNGNDDDLH